MRSAAVLRILIALFLVLLAVLPPAEAHGQAAVAEIGAMDDDGQRDVCIGHPASNTCCRASGGPFPANGPMSSNGSPGRLPPLAQVEPLSFAAGRIERPPRRP
jgi:hypothetical protein